MDCEELIGKYVEYRDKDWALRTGQVKKIYGGKVTVVLRWKRHVLAHERIPLDKITKIKNGRQWVLFYPK